jgi:hypothetical protein
MVATTCIHPLTRRPYHLVSSSGEYYRICCIFCRDTRHRLWINHMYGTGSTVGPTAGRPAIWPVICYNEDCLRGPARRQDLERRIYGLRKRHERNRLSVLASGGTHTRALGPVRPPGTLVPINQLDVRYEAAAYLVGRGYNLDYLYENFRVCYCIEADPEWPLARNRIVVPIHMHGDMVGWQCRSVGDPAGRGPKYWGMPGMPKSKMLYNYDSAKLWPFVVVVEGAPAVWKIGGPAVALLGKTLTTAQQLLFYDTWPGRPIVLILDPDARDNMEGMLDDILRSGRNPVVPLYLPEGFDPGDYTHEANVNMIRAAARQAGFELPEW